MIPNAQSIDNGLLTSHKNFSPIGQYMADKKRMPVYYGTICIFRAILVHNSAKYQYFSIRLSSFDQYYQIKHSLQFSAHYFSK